MQVSILTYEQVYLDKKLEIFYSEKLEAKPTDLALILASKSLGFNEEMAFYIKPYHLSLKAIYSVDPTRMGVYNEDVNGVKTGLRLAIPLSSIDDIDNNLNYKKDSADTICFGEYPINAVKEDLNDSLETLYKANRLGKTGKVYHLPTNRVENLENYESLIEELSEYRHFGRKYVRVVCKHSGSVYLNNGLKTRLNKAFWLQVDSLEWYLDHQSGLLISKNVILAGIPYFNNIKNKTYENSNIYNFIDKYFINEFMHIPETPVKKKSNASFDFSLASVSEEDIIRGAVLSDIAVFLHGRSSEGKSARVKEIDPNAEIIYLRNVTPDYLNGKTVYNADTKEMIDMPPTWYKRVKEKCEKEPNKLHIVFFDEITNALHSIQGMAFNIILNKEINGIWKLPNNARIVAAGNDVDDSLAANTLVEPLFNRFAHVYIKTDVKSWLKWAVKDYSKEKPLEYVEQKFPKIHPAVYGYISLRGEDVLRTNYDGEKPNADPRKWEMASKMLFVTKKPKMLRSLVGEAITNDFCLFLKQKTLTINDVLNGNYTIENIKQMTLDMRCSLIVSLALVEEENLLTIRNFVSKFEKELLELFDSLWLQYNPTRGHILAKLKYIY